MVTLDDYFQGGLSLRDSHPLVRWLDAERLNPEFAVAKVHISRPRSPLGFEPAQLSLQFFDRQDRQVGEKLEAWDAELNEALVVRRIRAFDREHEAQRFSLGLGAALQWPERRYGDGFFNTVLLGTIDLSPLMLLEPIQALRPYLPDRKPREGQAAEDCAVMIRAAMAARWRQLREQLGYAQQDAEQILTEATAYYLDDRFSVTAGRRLGWLEAKC